jgi:hypothetical protein
MPNDDGRPLLHPVLRFTKDPKPRNVTGRSKDANAIKVARLDKQRDRLGSGFRELSELASDQPSFAGQSVIYASMFDDSLAPTYLPKDLFSWERGAKIIAPYRSGYLVQVQSDRLPELAKFTATASTPAAMVDISRVEAIRFFDEEDATGIHSVEEAWSAAPPFDGGRAFMIWLMPLVDHAASETLLTRVEQLRGRALLPVPPATRQLGLDLTGAPTTLTRALRAIESADRLSSALRAYRLSRRASATVVVPSLTALSELVGSGAVFRLEPVRPIASTSPGEGAEPDRPIPSEIRTMPVVGVVDGGLTASSYRSAEAWRSPALVADGYADHVHGNRVTSLVVQGHDWNNGLSLPELYCQIGVVQAIPRRGSGALVDAESFIQHLDAVMTAYPATRVWNLSLNEPGACDPEKVSYLGHQLARLARKHKILPVISTGNRPGDILQPPADCEAGLTAGGRLHDSDGRATNDCPVSLPGPGPSGMLKPEISNFSHVRVIGGLTTSGSSYSAALTSPLAAHTIERLRDPSPDLAKALILHGAAEGAFDPGRGFGSPGAVMPWEAAPGTVTLQWRARLKPGAAYYWELPIPPSLIRAGKLIGSGKLTAILNPHPLTSEFAGPNYFGARLETALQVERGDKFDNILGSIETGKLTEEQARSFDHKWSPVRHHAKKWRSKKFTGSSMRVYARCFTRDLYLHGFETNTEVPEMDVCFVLSLATADGSDAIFGEIRSALGAFVEVATIDVDVDIDIDDMLG